MRKFNICTILFIVFFSLTTYAQTFDGEWTADYVTPDDAFSTNSVGERVTSVGAFEENSFVALVRRSSKKDYYLVGYKNANHDTGRLGNYPYNPDSLQTKWINFFDQAFLNEAKDLATTSNSLFYVANNDADRNILMFELKDDSIYTYPKRFKTKAENALWAIDVDNNGFVYVTSGGDSSNAAQVLIYNSNEWKSDGKSGTLLQTITLPDVGSVRGLTVNSNGSLLYVSNWMQNKVYCYIGNPNDGYTLYDGFNFNVSPIFEYTLGETKTAPCGPWGLQFMDTKNILLITHDSNFGQEGKYHYGRVYFANPNTGEVLDTLDVAAWNYQQAGQYDNPDTNGTASGYTSVFNVDYDNNFNLYTTSYYGWAVDKWKYSSELPTIEITITDVEKINNEIPNSFVLQQNYPNPFNPTTTIEFSLNKAGKVNLSVYTLSGELVTTLIESQQYNAGTYKITMDASLLSSGIYFYTLKLGKNTITKKMTLLK